MAASTLELVRFFDGGVTYGATVSFVFDTVTMIISQVIMVIKGGTLTVHLQDSASGQNITQQFTASQTLNVPASTFHMYTLQSDGRNGLMLVPSSSTMSYSLGFR